MKGSEFLRKLDRLAAKKGVSIRFIPDEGHGSHGRVYFGAEFTTLKDRKKEIGPGLLSKMCCDLGIDKREL
jgi:mRNA interferase HicA